MRSRIGLAPALLLAIPLAACDANLIGGGDGGGGGRDGAVGPIRIPGCTGACTVNYQCPTAMGPTTLTGVVNIPAGNLPVYNAQVYIPTGASIPPAPTTGVSCDRCVSTP